MKVSKMLREFSDMIAYNGDCDVHVRIVKRDENNVAVEECVVAVTHIFTALNGYLCVEDADVSSSWKRI